MRLMASVVLLGVGAAIGSAATALIGCDVRAAPTENEELDPVKVAPTTHRLVFENQYVKVIEAKIPPGVRDAKHKHNKGVLVFLDDYDMQMTYFPKGDTKVVHRTAKTAVWSEALVHETVNIGKTTSHAIRIELKDQPGVK